MILFGIVFFCSILLFMAIGKLCTSYLQRKETKLLAKACTDYVQNEMERSLKNQEKRSGN